MRDRQATRTVIAEEAQGTLLAEAAEALGEEDVMALFGDGGIDVAGASQEV